MSTAIGSSAAKARLWAIIIGCAIVIGLLIWQLYTLSPKHWCNSAVDQTKITGESIVLALQACLNLQIRILDIKDHAVIGLIFAIIVTNLLFMVSEFRVRASVTAPGGFGGSLGNDDAPPVPFKGEVEGTIIPKGEGDPA